MSTKNLIRNDPLFTLSLLLKRTPISWTCQLPMLQAGCIHTHMPSSHLILPDTCGICKLLYIHQRLFLSLSAASGSIAISCFICPKKGSMALLSRQLPLRLATVLKSARFHSMASQNLSFFRLAPPPPRRKNRNDGVFWISFLSSLRGFRLGGVPRRVRSPVLL